VELPFYIFFTLFRGCKARGYGGDVRVCRMYNNNTTPENVDRVGHFGYRLPNTEHRIAYTVYRIPYSVFDIPYIRCSIVIEQAFSYAVALRVSVWNRCAVVQSILL